jgi:phage FluMu protein Com
MQKEIRCDQCDRFLGKAYGTIVAEIKCSNSKCKKLVQVKSVSNDRVSDIRFKFPETDSKQS